MQGERRRAPIQHLWGLEGRHSRHGVWAEICQLNWARFQQRRQHAETQRPRKCRASVLLAGEVRGSEGWKVVLALQRIVDSSPARLGYQDFVPFDSLPTNCREGEV